MSENKCVQNYWSGWKDSLQQSKTEKMYAFGGCSRKRNKKTSVAPAVVFTPVQPVTHVPVHVGGHPPTLQSLVQMWPSPLVILSPTVPWAAQPSIPSTSEHSSVQNDPDKVLVLPFFFSYLTIYVSLQDHGKMVSHMPNDSGASLSKI